MTVYVTHGDGEVIIQARAEGPGMIGDMVRVLLPGDSFLGHPYRYWAALPDGEHAIPSPLPTTH